MDSFKILSEITHLSNTGVVTYHSLQRHLRVEHDTKVSRKTLKQIIESLITDGLVTFLDRIGPRGAFVISAKGVNKVVGEEK